MFIDPNIETILRASLHREGWPAPARARTADKGGLTRGGITAKNWGDYKHLGRPATAEELNAITEEQALEFYFQRYVELPHFDQVLDQKLRALLVDWAFTSWYDDPTKALQRSLATRGLYHGAIDGALGPMTISALRADRDPRRLYQDVSNDRVRFYVALALSDDGVEAFMAAHPESQLHNLKGWLNRALEMRA